MTKLITVEGIKINGVDSVKHIDLEFPLADLPFSRGKIEEVLLEFAQTELEKLFGSSFKGFNSVKEKYDNDCTFLLYKEEHAVYFTSEEELFGCLEHNKFKILETELDHAKKAFWRLTPINSFILAYMFFRDCMHDSSLLYKFDLKNDSAFTYMKVMDEELPMKLNEMFFYEFHYFDILCELKLSFDIELNEEFSKGSHTKKISDLTFPSLAATNIQKELTTYHDVVRDKIDLEIFLASAGIELKKETYLDFIQESNGNCINLTRNFEGIKNNKPFLIEFSLDSQNVKVYHKENNSNIILNSKLIRDLKKDESTIKLYEEISIFNYKLEEEIFNVHLLLKNDIYDNFKIFTSPRKLRPHQFSINLNEVDKKEIKKRINELKNLYLKELEESDILDNYLNMLIQFIEDGHKQLNLTLKKSKQG